MKKKALSLCIALALTNNVMADTTIQNETEQPACPTNISTLTQEQREELPTTCLEEEDDLWTWLAGGLAASVAAITAIAINSNDDGGSSNQSISGGSEGGSITPLSPVIFSNGVTFDPNARTVTFNNITYQYVQDGDKYTLTAPDGTVLYTDRANLTVDINRNLLIRGQDANGLYWSFNAVGKFIRAGVDTRVITGNGSSNTIDTGSSASGKNTAGTIVDGDNTSTVINGGSNATNGGTATKVDGNGVVVDNTGGTNASGEGSTGTSITGDNGKVINEGATNITDGGTGTRIDGNHAQVDNTGGSSISGNGSTGTDVKGDDAVINNTGNTNISDGGTGTKIDGNNARIDNKGDTAATGAGTAGVVITGDGAVVNNTGDTSVTEGATGTQINGNGATVNIKGDDSAPAKIDVDRGGKGVVINGNNARLVIDNALSTVDGQNSVLVDINGNDASVSLNGDIRVSNSAHGIDIEGSRAAVNIAARLLVEDLNSVGINVLGADSIFTNTGNISVSKNATGAIITGDNSNVTLGGSVNVTAVKDSLGVLQNGNGVVVNSNNSAIDIKGSINLRNENVPADVITPSLAGMTGVAVNGNQNTINIGGSVNVSSVGNIDPHDYVGVDVTGTGNNIAIAGGVNLLVDSTYWVSDDSYAYVYGASDFHATGLKVTGNNRVTVSGESSVTNASSQSDSSLYARVSDGGQLLLTEGSTLELNYNNHRSTSLQWYGMIQSIGQGSLVNNAGLIDTSGAVGALIMDASNKATAINSGTIRAYSGQRLGSAALRASGATVENRGVISVVSLNAPYYNGGDNSYPIKWYANTYYGELATYGATAVNTDTGNIQLQGAGLFGVAANQNSVAVNQGQISLDGFMPVFDEQGQIAGKTAYTTSTVFNRGAGMVAGSTDGALRGRGATALNAGNITVTNSGFGMLAMGGGTVTNQGTITLKADEGTVKGGTPPQLVGMGAILGGAAINDVTGKIVINTDVGQAFYNDGSSLIINRGEIVVGEGVDESVDNGRDPAVVSDKTILAAIPAGRGETQALTSATGFASASNTANYGILTLNSDFTAFSWLFNEADAVLNLRGPLTLKTGLENKGDITATAISTQADVNVYNRAGASLTVNDKLYLKINSNFFNEGTFTGTVTENHYLGSVVNTGTMKVARDGAAVMEGSAIIYNQKGGLITNTGNVVDGGANALINSTRSDTINFFMNSGTISAKNGYSALNTYDVTESQAVKPLWLYNNATGVIEGIDPVGPLLDLGRGYNFYNDGTITVQGNNAVAISGGITGYAANLVNSGTINVGTEVGKTNGTNGTNLVGIKGNGVNTTINNAADGVINIYADSSYAFGGT
ncbi:beta strand repeat-containing protein, partial [Budvicia diplopodorum]|uniref:beta strand repeat-containing protein n=1 Tax=Budvicia diplopodorum TaxID=1119056 RepID=UPI00135B0946